MSFFKKTSGITKILVGLGNPGDKYDRTRHNAGFHALDAIASQCNVKINRVKFRSLTAEVMINGTKCLLMKPQTYMNNSGDAVEEARSYYKLPIESVIVFFDDISLNPGDIRIRRKGTHGGHNGIKSIIAMTGEETFPRVKLGVGAKPHPDFDLADWVLSSFTKQEQSSMEKSYEQCRLIAPLMAEDKIDEAMNKYNV